MPILLKIFLFNHIFNFWYYFIGRSGWILPLTSIDYPAGLERFKWFAQFFLEGIISPKLQKYRYELLSSPDTIFKGWAKL